MKKLKRLALAGSLLAGWCVYPLAVRADDSSTAPAAGLDKGTTQGPPPQDVNGTNPAAGPQGDPMDGAWIDKAKDKLKLSDDQVTRLHKAVADEKNAVTPLQEDMKTQIHSLVQKLQSGAGDDALKPVLDQIDQDNQAFAADRQKTTEAFRDILTPTQQAKILLSMTVKRMKMMREMRDGTGSDGGNSPDNGGTSE